MESNKEIITISPLEKESRIIKRFEKLPISKQSSVEATTQFYLLHEYLNILYNNPQKDTNAKFRDLEFVAGVIGRNIMERISEDSLGRFKDKLEIIKFICKDFWTYMFGKIVDKLQTDSKGKYIIVDSDFKFLRRIFSIGEEGKDYSSFCAKFIVSLIKSALLTFQFDSEVSVETMNNVEFSFIIKVK